MDFEQENDNPQEFGVQPEEASIQYNLDDGILMEIEEPEKKRKKKIYLSTAVYIIILSVVTTVCIVLIAGYFAINRMGGNALGISSENWERLKWGFAVAGEAYYQEADERELVDGALMGLSLALDEYSMYLPSDDVEEFMSGIDAKNYCGAGMYIVIDTDEKCVRVIEPLPGSPAEKAGIESGDIIKLVDGEAVGDDVERASDLLLGEKGSKVTLTVIRVETGAEEEITLVRDEIKQDVLTSEMIEGDIGYIELKTFGSDTYEHFIEEFNKLKEKGMKKLIIDIRNNPGGYVDSATAIAEIFLDKNDLIISTKNRNGNVREYRAASDGVDVETVVLCNENSASASEILTVSLKDNGKATVVGTKTFGKGVIQAMIPYKDGSMFKITEATYYSPKDICIDKKGVEPNIKVKDKPETVEDEQFEAALEVLKKD